MEQNEIAIVDVLQQRRRDWQSQMTALGQEWERKLRCQQQKSFRAEQSLLLQICNLQQENKTLRCRVDQSRRHGETADELKQTHERLDQLQSELSERTNEAGALRAKLGAVQAELQTRTAELAATRVDVESLRSGLMADLESQLAGARSEARVNAERASAAERRLAAADEAAERGRRDAESARDCADQLRGELIRARALQDDERAKFELERGQWLEEKRRVIDYQKQLQLNYIQMARKNKLLEADVHQLTAEIERQESSAAAAAGRTAVRVTEESLC
jgi:chromosome segregation ATPase